MGRQKGFKQSPEEREKRRQIAINNQQHLHFGDITGMKNGNAKLTDEQILEIKALQGKMKQRQIARKFNITPSYVSLIFKGKRRTYIDSPLTDEQKKAIEYIKKIREENRQKLLEEQRQKLIKNQPVYVLKKILEPLFPNNCENMANKLILDLNSKGFQIVKKRRINNNV